MVFSLKRMSRQRQFVAGLMLAASVTVVSACAETPSETTTTEEATENVDQEELSSGAEGLIGQQVSIRGEVAEVDESSFTIADNQLFGGEDILVINTTGEPFILPEGDNSEVQVTGEVQQLVTADFEREYGLTLDPTLYADYEDRPVIVASSLALAPDPGDLTSNPEKYYNQRIAVQGEIEDILSPTTFTLDEEQLFGGDLLVLSQMASPQAQGGESVTVTGTLRPYVAADFERDYELDWDATVQQQIEVEYSEKPVFVADEVYPSAM
ncbi:hypothetical protein [Leptolyngbya sp. BC1307]|uniref:hypothetical protein n=1 Tax=Leptolyngbya sp. BC1307 TaxID=2029589 RepID=UPI000EFD97C7|nr:hypothetical protein [Leptolyngbya sp. BC1307]